MARFIRAQSLPPRGSLTISCYQKSFRMNEPLTNSRPGISFCGKTYNKHPQWYNLPLRLSEEELDNPILVFNEFFQCYHLNETREVLWQWLSAIISSPGSISSEPLERSNHLYFYEKVEEIIEAAFLLKELKKGNQDADLQSINEEDTASVTQPAVEKIEKDAVFTKPKQLIEYASENPQYVIREVFMPQTWFDTDIIREWLFICLSVDCTIYDEVENRSRLILFHIDLLSLIEALFVINLSHIEDGDLKHELSKIHIHELGGFQVENPKPVLDIFFKKYSAEYITRELDDWYKASTSYTGDWIANIICQEQIWDIYRNVLCLIKAAEALNDQQD